MSDGGHASQQAGDGFVEVHVDSVVVVMSGYLVGSEDTGESVQNKTAAESLAVEENECVCTRKGLNECG